MKRTRILALATAGLAAGVVVTPTPTQAAANGYLHMYENDNYGRGTMGRAEYDANLGNDVMCRDSSGRWYKTSYKSRCDEFGELRWSVNDTISSIDNNTSYWWKLYEDRDYGGYTLCVRPWGYDNNLGNNTPLEDDISSVKRATYDPDKNDQPGGCDKVIG